MALIVSSQVQAQEPQPVYSIVKEVNEFSWYETQSELWKAEIDKNDQNAEAWYYYYAANRAMKNLQEDNEKRKLHEVKCREIADEAIKTIPETFEGNHLYYWDRGFDSGESEYLFMAHEIAPQDSRAFADLLIYFELKRESVKQMEMAKLMFKENLLPSILLNWGYNVLAELDENAIVFTGGDNDTYALWLVQGALGFRQDVTVMNTYMMTDTDYRKLMLEELEMGSLEIKPDEDAFNTMFQYVFDNSKERSVYVAMSCAHQFQKEEIKKNLYLNGLTYKYSITEFDNTSVIRRNYEKRYLIDYLKQEFSTVEFRTHLGKNLNGMYLASMIKLYKTYKIAEENDEAAELKKLIDKIAGVTGQIEEIEKLLKASGC